MEVSRSSHHKVGLLPPNFNMTRKYFDHKYEHKQQQGLFSSFRLFMASLQKGMTDLTIQSEVLRNYFFEVSFPNVKHRFRILIKGCNIFNFHAMVVMSQLFTDSSKMQMKVSAAFLLIGLFLYFMTLTSYKNKYRSFCYNIILIVLLLFLILHENYGVISGPTPLCQMVVIVYNTFLLNVDVTLFVSCLLTAQVCRLGVGEKSVVREDGSAVDFEKYIHTGATIMFLKINQTDVDKTVTSNSKMNIANYILMFLLNFVGIFLHSINRFRQLSAFKQLGQNVQIRAKISAKKEEAMVWIAAIMPSCIIPDYMKFMREMKYDHSREGSKILSVFNQSYNDVSILFADIVGFTNMSSNKVATQIVMLLNSLFNSFDAYCTKCGCEKLGTLGDCYYCVAGCPIPRRDHANCCVRMGLGMCVIIQDFNKEHNERVNMRVGIHTGRVNAAVIGKCRFRYDVYSYAVIIANEMESSGMPGRVHISESTFHLVQHYYPVEPGEDLEIKVEKQFGIHGSVMTIERMKTYFVIASNVEGAEFQANDKVKAELKVIADVNALDSGSQSSGSDESESEEDEDVALVRAMKVDPEHQADLFIKPPLHPVTQSFVSESVERDYRNLLLTRGALTFESARLAPTLDGISSSLTLLIMTIVVAACFPDWDYSSDDEIFRYVHERKLQLMSMVLKISLPITANILSLILVIPLIMECIWPDSTPRFLRTYLMRNIRQFLYGMLPFVVILCKQWCFSDPQKIYRQSNILSLFTIHSILHTLLFTSGSSWVNIGTVFLRAFIAIDLFTYNNLCQIIGYNGTIHTRFEYNTSKCGFYRGDRQADLHIDENILYNVFGIICTAFIVCSMALHNDQNLRLSFFATLEADRRRRQAEEASHQTQELLYNIVPEFVMLQLRERGVSLANASYAIAVDNSGVAFASISNFFSSYYREDFKGGESALALLNKIISTFDETTMKNEYKDVDKVKTINDCYMVASGLNVQEVQKNFDVNDHLHSLLDFCIELIEIIDEFNLTWVIGDDKFKLKIGYNTGPITAGIIGTTKPLFDIWGDTVNVASRMYSTGAPGMIQVPVYVRKQLRKRYDFKKRGEIFVKGKGMMQTFTYFRRRYA